MFSMKASKKKQNENENEKKPKINPTKYVRGTCSTYYISGLISYRATINTRMWTGMCVAIPSIPEKSQARPSSSFIYVHI